MLWARAHAPNANAAPETGPAMRRVMGMVLGTNSRLTGFAGVYGDRSQRH